MGVVLLLRVSKSKEAELRGFLTVRILRSKPYYDTFRADPGVAAIGVSHGPGKRMCFSLVLFACIFHRFYLCRFCRHEGVFL